LHSLKTGAAKADGVIHLAMNHDFSRFAENCAEDERAIAALGSKGVSAYVGDGQNRWPAVHRLDAAPVYRLALEKADKGAAFHAVAEEGVPFKEIAELIGRRLNLPVVSKSREEAAEHFGWFAMFAGIDAPTSSAVTRTQLGWTPEGPSLIADLDHPAYFAS